MKLFLTVLVLFNLALLGYAQQGRDREEKVENTDVKVKGRSGEMSIGRRKKTRVVIKFEDMKERNESDSIVGGRGPRPEKHSFNSFASQDFNFSRFVDYEYNGFRTKTFNFTAFLAGTGATLNVQVYFFLQGGEFTNGNEITNVTKGTVKFNIEITNWEFCNGSSNCGNDEKGKYVDFVMSVKSKSSPQEKQQRGRPPLRRGMRRPREFDLGEESLLSLSKEIDIDGTPSEMPGEYPKHDSKGGKEFFTFRFPKFVRRVVYDPTLTMTDDGGNAAIGLKASFIVFLGGLLAAILAIG